MDRRRFLHRLAGAGILYDSRIGLAQEQTPQEIAGDQLLRAAERGDWITVRRLLESGADPDIVQLTPAQPLSELDRRGRYALQRLNALGMAAEQGNSDAVRLLLRFKADVNKRGRDGQTALIAAARAGQAQVARMLLESGADPKIEQIAGNAPLWIARQFGGSELIRLFEDALGLPSHRRTLPLLLPPSNPARPRAYAPETETEWVQRRTQHQEREGQNPGPSSAAPLLAAPYAAYAAPVPGTRNGVATRNSLWVSPSELLVVRQDPVRSVTLVNADTGVEQVLPALNVRWGQQKVFDPRTLVLSLDGKWLLGQAGTLDRPTWLATEVKGAAYHEWPRDTQKDTGGSPFPDADEFPSVAWLPDNETWVELRQKPRHAIRLRRLQSSAVEEAPFEGDMGYFTSGLSQDFRFTPDGRGWQTDVGRRSGRNEKQQRFDEEKSETVAQIVAMSLETTFRQGKPAAKWRLLRTEGPLLPAARFPGFFRECIRSPRGDLLVWLNEFQESDAVALLVSRPDGSGMRSIFERAAVRPEWPQTPHWTPDGRRVAFWWGDRLYTVPVC